MVEPSEHRTTVRQLPGGPVEVRCRCGWNGTAPTDAVAEREAARHRAGAHVEHDHDELGCPREGILLGYDSAGVAQSIGVRLPFGDEWVVYNRRNESTRLVGESKVRELLLRLAREVPSQQQRRDRSSWCNG